MHNNFAICRLILLTKSFYSHNNSGPKFGIKLLSHETCRTVQTLNIDHTQICEDLLHIPTPWHNCVVTIENDPCYYVVKSKVASDAIASGMYTGTWKDGGYGEGGHFILRRTGEKIATELKALTLSSQPLSPVVDLETSADVAIPTQYGFLIPPTFRARDIAEVLDAITILQSKYQQIELHFIGLDKNPVSNLNLVPTHTLETCPKLQVLFVPGVLNTCDLDSSFYKLLADKCEATPNVFGVNCAGAMMLARAGVLDGKKAVTKVTSGNRGINRGVPDIRSFENVNWEMENGSGWICDDGIWTSSNQSASIEALYSYIEESYPDGDLTYVKNALD